MSRAIRVAPRGGVSGLLHVEGLTVVVLPKLWRQTRGILAAPARGTLVCHELDTLVFPGATASDDPEAVVKGLLELRGCGPGADRELSVAEEVVVPREPAVVADDTVTEEALDALLGLLELSLRATSGWRGAAVLQSVGADRSSLDDPSATREQAWLLQEVLRARHLVRLVQERMRELRPTYAETEERTHVIRGRMRTRSLFRAQATGEVECEFEEFSEVSPLFRVVRTTLDLLVGNSDRWGWLAKLPLAAEILDGASAIQARLQHISSMPRAEAARVALHTRPGRTLRRWEPVRALCASILVDSPPGYGDRAAGGDGGSGFVVNTPALWQALVDHAVRTLPGARPAPLPRRVALWSGAPFQGKAVDSSTVYRGARWLLDAKYKDFPDRGAPSFSDQYQMFGYSHLYDQVAHVALVYPHPPTVRRWRRSPPYLRGGSAAPCTLRLVSAPFPDRGLAADSEAAWARAIGAIREVLGAVLQGRRTWVRARRGITRSRRRGPRSPGSPRRGWSSARAPGCRRPRGSRRSRPR